MGSCPHHPRQTARLDLLGISLSLVVVQTHIGALAGSVRALSADPVGSTKDLVVDDTKRLGEIRSSLVPLRLRG